MKVKDLFDLTGKVCIVTGATGGLGGQMASALAEMGGTIVVASRDLERCERAASNLRSSGCSALPARFDLGDRQSITQMVDGVAQQLGRIDVLLNCAAAIGLTTPYQTLTAEIWEATIRINLTGTFWCSQAAASHMKLRRQGKIINVVSVYGALGVDPRLYGVPGEGQFEHFAYSASKGGVLNLTRDMAANLARWNINVNSISPGMFPSEAVKRKFGPETFQRLTERTPLQRPGGEDDLKGAAVYLASAASDFVTGQNIIVDGGWSIW